MADLFTDEPSAFEDDPELPALVDGNKFFAAYYTRIRTHLANLNNRIRGGLSFSLVGDLVARRLHLVGGVATPTVALSAGWGTTATYAIRSGSNDEHGRVVVTSNGTGQSSQPTVTIPLSRPFTDRLPFVIVVRNQGSGSTSIRASHTPPSVLPYSAIVAVLDGTPVAGSTYGLDWFVFG